MRTKGEIEAAISEEISRFERDCIGRKPKDIQVHLLGDLLLIRLRGVLAAAEHQLEVLTKLQYAVPADHGTTDD